MTGIPPQSELARRQDEAVEAAAKAFAARWIDPHAWKYMSTRGTYGSPGRVQFRESARSALEAAGVPALLREVLAQRPIVEAAREVVGRAERLRSKTVRLGPLAAAIEASAALADPELPVSPANRECPDCGQLLNAAGEDIFGAHDCVPIPPVSGERE